MSCITKVRSVSEGKLFPYVWDGSPLGTLYGRIIYSDVGNRIYSSTCKGNSYGLEIWTSQMWEPTLSFLYVGIIDYQPPPEQDFTGYLYDKEV